MGILNCPFVFIRSLLPSLTTIVKEELFLVSNYNFSWKDLQEMDTLTKNIFIDLCLNYLLKNKDK